MQEARSAIVLRVFFSSIFATAQNDHADHLPGF